MDPRPLTGRTVAHYEVIERLCEGGMGVVYKARDTRLDRIVVLKVLRPEALNDTDRRRRFVQEAHAASALNSPHIITIHDIARHDDLDFIVMEFVHGRPLDYLIPTGGMAADQIVRYGTQICDALATAHDAGIIHRDLKPGNIMVTPAGHVKLLDFGLAKLTAGILGTDATGTRTAPGTIVGTVCYMSPEQAMARPLDVRSDLFSLGAVLYEMATGRRAFGSKSPLRSLTSVLRDNPAEPVTLNASVPTDLNRLIMRCLSKEPSQRPASAHEVREAFRRLGARPHPDAQGFRALGTFSAASALEEGGSFEEALKGSADQRQVFAGESDYYAQLILGGFAEPSHTLPKALWAARQALDLDPDAESVQLTVATLRANCDFRWSDAMEWLNRPLAGRNAHRRGLWLRRPLGQFVEAMTDVGEDSEAKAWIALESGNLIAAERHAARAELDSWIACWVSAWVSIAAGRTRHAIETCHSGLGIDPGNSRIESALASAYVLDRQPDRAHQILGRTERRPASFAIPVWAAAGESDLVFETGRQAVLRRDPGLITVLRLPVLQRLRSDLRYTHLLDSMRLTPPHTSSVAPTDQIPVPVLSHA